MRARGGSAVLPSAIGHSLSTMGRETRAQMGRMFELCFVMAKESIPFAKYPALLQLEEHHGVDVGSAYRTPDHRCYNHRYYTYGIGNWSREHIGSRTFTLSQSSFGMHV